MTVVEPSPGRRSGLLAGLFAVIASVLLLSAYWLGQLSWPVAAAFMALLLLIGMALLLIDHNDQLRENARRLARLQAQHAQHETAEQMASLGLWSLDLHGNTLRWSSGAFRVYGVQPGTPEPSLREFLDAVHPDDRRRWQNAHRRTLRRGNAAKLEYRYQTGTEREVWLRSVARRVHDERGRPLRLEGTVQDISGIRAMQRQLASSEAKFRDLTQLSSDWIWESNAALQLTALSDSVDTVLGPWARRTLGRRLWDPGTPDPYPVDWSGLKKQLQAGKPLENFEFALLDDERRAYHIAISGRATFNEQNRFTGYRGTGHDITHEKQQRLLLELDGDMASVMREQTDPSQVVAAIVELTCQRFGWLGGLRLSRVREQVRVRERWGHEAFMQMAENLPARLPLETDRIEGRVWASGKAAWLADLRQEPGFARRYHFADLGAQAALVAPISDEQGTVLSALVFLSPVSYSDDTFLARVAASLSRTLSLYLQRTHAQRRLHHASLHDSLTGLPNRAHVTQVLDDLLGKSKPLALLYIDLDRYKLINDTLGHGAGDRALVEVARRLTDALPEDGIAGRMGGDEFVVLLKAPVDRDAVAGVGRRILHAVEQPLVLANQAYFLSASIGIAMAPQDSREASALVKAADAAMYEVKSEGRNGLRFFAGQMQSAAQREQMQLASELPLAMRRGEVELFYQPVMAVRSRTIVGLEGLLRWRHPSLGLLRPERFLSAAEQSNLIREIDTWAIRRAIRDRIALGLTRHDELAVSVNVSVRHLAEDGFLESLYSLLQERRFPAQLLRLELTESAFIERPERTVSLITELRRIGVKVIIDNFGTGYSSLSHVKNLPVDGLKIDKAFIRDLPADRGNVAIVQAVTTLAEKLGMQAMAEGVETADELRALRELNCDVMQGTLISPPLPFDDVANFLESVPGLRRMHVMSGTMTLQ